MTTQTEAQRILAQWQKCESRIAELEAINEELLEALITAYGHIDPQKLVISHYKDNSLIRAAIAKHGGNS